MLKLTEYKQPKRLAHRLPWALLIGPGVVLNKVGSFQATAEFRGPDLFSSTEEELDVVSSQINNALKRLGSGWAYFIETQRRQCQDYPKSNWPNIAGKLIDDERKALFVSEGDHYASAYFLTFSYLPPTESVNKIADRFFMRENGANNINYEKHLSYFQSQINKIIDVLKSIFPHIELLDDGGTLTYLHSCVSTKYHPVKCPKTPAFIDSIITDQHFKGGLEPKLGNCHLKLLSVSGFPVETYPGIFQELDKAACEYRWVTRYICLDKLDTLRELKKYSRKWFAKRKSIVSIVKEALMNEPSEAREDSDAVNKSIECDEASQVISSNIVSAGYYSSCVVIWDEDPQSLYSKTRTIEQIINSAGFVTIDETYNAVQAWFGTIPGHCWANVRRPLMTSLNLTHLIPGSADWTGPMQNSHLKGPPLFYAKTSGNTPFRFSNHVGDVGHTMVVGPTGSGKSVLLCFMASQFLRYKNSQVYMFDKDFSSYCTTVAMGGEHYDLGEDTSISFQPLKSIDSERERSWALEWLLDVVAIENVQITPAQKIELWNALSNLSSSPVKQRTITSLATLIQDKQLREALHPYTIEGPFGYLLDADVDKLQVARWQCFEMDYLMNYTPGVVIPVLTYLFHQLDLRFTGDPTILVLDEVWLFLSNPVFAGKIKDWLKTLRKKNVSVVFATQSLSDVIESPIVGTLIDSCPTRVFLPNPKALEKSIKDQYTQFGLNNKQLEIIANAIPKREYYCQSFYGNRLFELGLGPITLSLCASSSPEDIKKMRQFRGQNLNNRELLIQFISYKRGGHHED